MDRNYCFRCKRHSYAACDAALAASLYILVQFLFLFFLIIINTTFLTGVKLLELYTDSSTELNTGSKIIFMFVDNFTLQKNC